MKGLLSKNVVTQSNKAKFTVREQRIMQEAFMVGRVYHAMGEKESPLEIQQKLEERCDRAARKKTND